MSNDQPGCTKVTFEKENTLSEQLPIGAWYLIKTNIFGLYIPIGDVFRYEFEERENKLTMIVNNDGGLQGSSIVANKDFPLIEKVMIEAGWIKL